MTEPAKFRAVYPIGDTDVQALPVKDVGAAIGFYSQVLGFRVAEREDDRAVLRRDDASIGLEKNESDPDQASCYFEVDDLDRLHAELTSKGIEPTAIQDSEDGGRRIRIFFAKEPYGVCFCFGSPAE